MLRAIILVALFLTQNVTPYKGYAVHYSPGLMERVANKRGLEQAECMISSPLTNDIGAIIIVESEWGTMACQVTDVSQPRHRKAQLRTKTYVEFNFEAAKKMCNITKVAEKPRTACPITIYIPS